MKSKDRPVGWLGPGPEILRDRLQRHTILQPSVDRVLEAANFYLDQALPSYGDTLENLSEDIFTGTHLGDRSNLHLKDPRWIVAVAAHERGGKVFSAILYLGFAYRITGDVRFAKAAIRWMVNCARWPLWTHPGWAMNSDSQGCIPLDGDGQSFATSAMLQAMAIGKELCRDQMRDYDLFEVIGAVVRNARRIVDDYQTGRPWYFCFGTVNCNQWTIQTAALGIAACGFSEFVPEAAQWLSLAKALTIRALDAQSPDGTYIEGVSYASYGSKDVILFAEMLACCGDASLVEHPHLSHLGEWYMEMTFPDSKRHININDSSQHDLLDIEGHPDDMSYEGFVTKAAQFVWFQHRYAGRGYRRYIFDVFQGIPASPWTLAWYDPADEETAAQAPPKEFRTYPSLGLHVYRMPIKQTDVLLGLVAGESQRGHKHADTNSVIFFAGCDYLLCDAGKTRYSDADNERYFSRSVAHNVVLIDGAGQQKGSGGSLVSEGKRGALRWMVTQADGCYDELTLFRRCLIFSEEQSSFVVLDHFRFRSEKCRQVEWLWHSEGKLQLESGSETALFIGEKIQMKVEPIIPGDNIRLEQRDGFLDGPHKPKARYLAVCASLAGMEGWSATKFEWADAGTEISGTNLQTRLNRESSRFEGKANGDFWYWNGQDSPIFDHPGRSGW